MYKQARPFFLHVITPLHAGSGEGLGVVDLPIQRERHTDFPKIEGSSLKGGIREAFEELAELTEEKDAYRLRERIPPVQRLNKNFSDQLKKQGSSREITLYDDQKKKEKKIKVPGTIFQDAVETVFGPDTAQGENLHAGALGFTDARLLLFPVKSMKGVFAWITCPMVLEKLKTDLELCQKSFTITTEQGTEEEISIPRSSELSKKSDQGCCAVTKAAQDHLAFEVDTKCVILEEYTFTIDENLKIDPLAQKLDDLTGNTHHISERLVLLSNDDFRDFVQLSTEVITRIKIDNARGTVQQGALFTEEYLPAETILYSLALATPLFTDDKNKGVFKQLQGAEEELVMKFLQQGLPETIQLGGNATIGKGLTATYIEGRN